MNPVNINTLCRVTLCKRSVSTTDTKKSLSDAFMVCGVVSHNMGRKTGFDKETYNEYKRLKAFGLSDRQVAQQWGWSASALSNIKLGKTKRVSKRLQDRAAAPTTSQSYDDRINTFVADDLTKITYSELQRLATAGRTPRTQKLAREKLSELDQSDLTIQELQQLTFDRPEYYRTIMGKRVKLLLGRTKGEEAQRSIKNQLREKGISFAGTGYVDFGGYGGVRQ